MNLKELTEHENRVAAQVKACREETLSPLFSDQASSRLLEYEVHADH